MAIHVLYAGADRFVASLVPKLGRLALEAFAHLDDAEALLRVAGIAVDPATLRERVGARLGAVPIEDFRIDFEDGYGVRGQDEEDRHADEAGRRLAEGHLAGTLPPSIGVRLRSLGDAPDRARRTLDRVLAAMVAGGVVRPLVVTAPKITSASEVAALSAALDAAERRHGLPPAALSLELMLEQPAAFLDRDGRVPIRALVAAGAGRVTSCHLGTFDLTAALGVPGWAQSPDHPAAALARGMAKLALHGTGVAFVDGATTRLPLPVVRQPSSDADRARNHEAIVGAMAEHAANVRRALSEGIEAGWDLHPAQIPARLVAVHATYLAHAGAMAERLRNFVDRQARATATGTAFDDAATGRALVSFFEGGRACGALDDAALEAAGVDRAPASWRA